MGFYNSNATDLLHTQVPNDHEAGGSPRPMRVLSVAVPIECSDMRPIAKPNMAGNAHYCEHISLVT